MAAKTISVSGIDQKFRLLAPGFLLESSFVAVHCQVSTDFTLRAHRHADVGSATGRNAVLALSYLQNETSQKSQTFHVRIVSYVVHNAAKILGPGVKLRAGGRPNIGQKRQECRHGSTDKCIMSLSYNLEIFPEYLAPKHKIRPQMSAS